MATQEQLDFYNKQLLTSGQQSLSVGYPTTYSGGIKVAPLSTGTVTNPFVGPGAGSKTIPTYGAQPLQQTQPGVSYLPQSAKDVPSATAVYPTKTSAPKTYPGVTSASLATPAPTPTAPTAPTPVPGSAAFLYQQSEQDLAANKMYDDIYKYQQDQFTQEVDPNKIYQSTLQRYQSQIDSINNMFNDQLNNSRIVNAPTYKARADQNRIQQVQGGLVSSPMGGAQTDNINTANAQEQAAAEAVINDKREQALARVFGQARESSEAELTQKREAKSKGADELLKYLNAAPERKKSKVSSLVKSLIAQGVDPKDLSTEELNKLAKDLGVAPGDIQGAYSESVAEQEKAALEQRKVEAEVSNLENKYEFEAAQKALDRALEEKRISVSWYNATTSRMSENRQSVESEEKKNLKNYDGVTIPGDVKSELIFDLQQNSSAKKKERKTLQEFFATYPEVNTKYLTELFEANN